MKPETIALHAGYAGRPHQPRRHHAHLPDHVLHLRQHPARADLFNLAVPGNIYSRIMNPTNAVLEQRLAELEGGGSARWRWPPGMAPYATPSRPSPRPAAISSAPPQLYGGTYNLFAHTFPRQGIEVRFAQADDVNLAASLIDENTKALFCESIGNPARAISSISRNGRTSPTRRSAPDRRQHRPRRCCAGYSITAPISPCIPDQIHRRPRHHYRRRRSSIPATDWAPHADRFPS